MSYYTNKLNEIQDDNLGITIRKIMIQTKEIYILFISQIVDRKIIQENIIKDIQKIKDAYELSLDSLIYNIISADDIFLDSEADLIIDYILTGNTLVILPDESRYIVVSTKKIEKRAVSPPEVQSVLIGPKDCFCENYDTNISLIRYRIKDKALKIDKFSLGKRTKTSIAIIYLKDVTNEKYVNEIESKIQAIDIDGILEANYIKKILTNKSFSLFPIIGIAERSDSACAEILDGKVCIVVEGSNIALIAPKTFIEFSDSGDDHYQNVYVGILSKSIRLMAILLTLTLSSLYVASVGFHTDILPIKYSLSLASSRSNVPFPSFIEALFAEGLSEILREASTRLTKQIGPAIGIVGTIVIGQAAVAAELISPLLVIIIAFSIMCSFVSPDFTIMNAIRILKFLMLFLTGLLGFLGFAIGFFLILTSLCSIDSFGRSYLNPILPFHLSDLKNFIFSDLLKDTHRPEYMHNKDNRRKK